MTTKICTLHYVAPEIVSRKELVYSEKCDVWSLGVILYLMLSGFPPFWGDDDMAVLRDIKKARYEFEPRDIWDGVSATAVTLIQKMLVVDADQRLSAADVANSEWFGQVCQTAHVQLSATIIYNMRAFKCQAALKKIALQVIAQQLSDESVADLRLTFDELDERAEGALKVEKIA